MMKIKDSFKEMKEMYESLSEEERNEIKDSFVDGLKTGCISVGAGVVVKGLIKLVTGNELLSDLGYLATSGTILVKSLKNNIEECTDDNE